VLHRANSRTVGLDFTGRNSRFNGRAAYHAGPQSIPRDSQVLDFINNPTGALAALTFTRASIATYVTSAGLIATAASGETRINHHPVTLARQGLLIEAQRPNRILRSQEYDNASWTKTDTTITADNITSPDGTQNADLLTEGTAGTSTVMQSVTGTADASYAVSRFIKQGNTPWVQLLVGNGANQFRAWFNLQTGVVGTSSASGTGTVTSATIEAFANGWYRCKLVGTVASGATAIDFHSFNTSADNSSTRVNNATRYEWGAQFEDGATTVSSYIPTTTASVTRLAEAATMAVGSWFNRAEGTLIAWWTPHQVTIGGGVAALNDGTSNNRVAVTLSTGPLGQGLIGSGGVTQANMTNGVPAVGTPAKEALAYALNDAAFCFNGGAVQTDTSVTLPTGINILQLGRQIAGTELYGCVGKVIYNPRRLSNTQLQALTQ